VIHQRTVRTGISFHKYQNIKYLSYAVKFWRKEDDLFLGINRQKLRDPPAWFCQKSTNAPSIRSQEQSQIRTRPRSGCEPIILDGTIFTLYV